MLTQILTINVQFEDNQFKFPYCNVTDHSEIYGKFVFATIFTTHKENL